MKIAPIYRAMLATEEVAPLLVHTGQHFDDAMSGSFQRVLELPQPDINLGVGPGSQAWQIATIMQRLEPVYDDWHPDQTVLVGDVSSTLAAALVSSTVGVPVAHVEAGLRSRDWTMPEERNRVLTDRLSRWLFTPSADADSNLLAEGIEADHIHFVGNVMIDSLEWALARIPREQTLAEFGLEPQRYGVVTLHRPGSVDAPETLRGLMQALGQIGQTLPLIFPVHPRTREQLAAAKEEGGASVGVRLLPPLDYLRFVALLSAARLVLTDSGGIQEEAVVLGVPCLTLRDNTERPVTVACGGNRVVGTVPERIMEATSAVLDGPPGVPCRPLLWDGAAAQRIVDLLGR